METKQINTTDSPINNLNQPGTYDNSNNYANWLGFNVRPQAPRNDFDPIDPRAATQAPAISARTASVIAPAPSSTVEERIFDRQYLIHFTRDLESTKFTSSLWSREIFSDDDKAQIEAVPGRFKQAELIMHKIQEKFAKATSNDDKQAITYVVHYTFLNIQRHLAKHLNKNHLKPFTEYNSNVQLTIDRLMGPESPLKKNHPRQNTIPSHNGSSGNGRACEHNDTTYQEFGTKIKYPVQATGDW